MGNFFVEDFGEDVDFFFEFVIFGEFDIFFGESFIVVFEEYDLSEYLVGEVV